MLEGDLARVLAELQNGLSTPEHGRFVEACLMVVLMLTAVSAAADPRVPCYPDCRSAVEGGTAAADWYDVYLPGADLPGLILWAGADLGNVNLTGANLRGAILPGVQAPRAVLIAADLTAANLSPLWRQDGDDGPRANLRGATLTVAVLRYANLHNAILASADLRGADLEGATLIGVDLTGADLTGTNLRDADISDAILSDVVGCDTQTQPRPRLPGCDLVGS